MKTTRRAGFYLIDCTRSLVLMTLLLGGFLVSLEKLTELAPGELHARLTVEGERAARELAHELARARITADPARSSGGETHGLAYVLPQDADGDGWPDLLASGNVLWEETPRVLLRARRPDGRDALVQRTPEGDSVLAHDVSRLRFEGPADDETLAPDALRVRITLRRTASDGTELEVETKRVVRLGNGAPRR